MGEIQGSLHYGGKSAASGRDDVLLWRGDDWRFALRHGLQRPL